jgi:hypothetical protein
MKKASTSGSAEKEYTASISGSQYEDDFYSWTHAQADILRRHQPEYMDWQNLAEELEALARSEERELRSRLENLLIHLLKWRHQPSRRVRSWQASVRVARIEIDRLLSKEPSLAAKLNETFAEAYETARVKAAAQMQWDDKETLMRLAERCEWPIATVRDPDFWPEESK